MAGEVDWRVRLPLRKAAPLVERLRRGLPYLPVRFRLPDGTTLVRYFGDRHCWRIVQEVCVENVYEGLSGFGPKAGETVLDIGAHIGVYAVDAAKKVGRPGLVIAVEAEPRNFRLLSRNARRQPFGRIRCEGAALWREPGTVLLNRDPSGFGAHSLILPRGGDSIRVRAQTLDDMAERLGLSDVSLLKLDVEGAAADILMGGTSVLKRWKPRIACAAYHTPDEVSRLSEVLVPLGYRVRTMDIKLPFAEGPETYLFASVPPIAPLT